MGKSKQLCFFKGENYASGVVTDEYATLSSCKHYFQIGDKLVYDNETQFAELMEKWLADDKTMKAAKLCVDLA